MGLYLYFREISLNRFYVKSHEYCEELITLLPDDTNCEERQHSCVSPIGALFSKVRMCEGQLKSVTFFAVQLARLKQKKLNFLIR